MCTFFQSGDKINVCTGACFDDCGWRGRRCDPCSGRKTESATGVSFRVTALADGGVQVDAKGQAAHASTPEEEKNADSNTSAHCRTSA